MNRRNLLVAGGTGVALGLSGCLDTVQSVASADPSENGAESCRTDSANETGREVCLVDVGTVPEDELEETSTDALPVEFDIELLTYQLTSDSIPKFEITIHNRGEGTLGVEQRALWFASIEPEGLLVRPENRMESIQSNFADEADGEPEGCIQTDDEFVINADYRVEKIGPGEQKQELLGIVGNEEELEGACPKPGEYTIYGAIGAGFGSDDEYMGEAVPWGFTIELT